MVARILCIIAVVFSLVGAGCAKPKSPAPAPSAAPVTTTPDATGQVRQQITDQPVVPSK